MRSILINKQGDSAQHMILRGKRMLTHLRRRTSVLALGVIFLTAPFGFAHARPKVMVPAPDSTVSAPSHVSVTFSEDLVAQFSSLNVTDEMGARSAVKSPKLTRLTRSY
jgi:methionine-rich copper-binding protein CopC